jgi:hypothetical protein
VSERRERSFLRRARDPSADERFGSQGPVEGAPQGPLGEPDPSSATEPPDEREPEAGGYRRGSELRRTMAVAAERVEQIITSAYEMADAIRRDAELEAERYLELRRREADLMIDEHLSDVRRALDQGRLELDDVERRLTAKVRRGHAVESPPPADPVPASAPERPSPSPSAYPGRKAESRPGSPWGDEHAAALIRASQLAIQGESRDAIESALRSDFGLEDPSEIVDQIMPRR